MPNKRRYLSDQEKADLLNAYSRLPEGRTGEREKFKTKHRLTWSLMHSWENMPGVKKLLGAPPQPAGIPRPDDVLQIPPKTEGVKRQFNMKQKAWLLAAYEALPFGSDARGHFLRKYEIYFNNLTKWRQQLKEEGYRLPNLKIQMTMNGTAPDFVIEEYGKPGPKLGSHQKNPRRPPGGFNNLQPKQEPSTSRLDTVDAITYLEIREEEARKIREELIKLNERKTRDV